MALLETIVGLTSLVIIGNILSKFLKRIPVSLIQIGLGLLAAELLHVKIELDTEWFLLLFIAPLLYSDAWRFPKKELWELRGPIFGNAILLVFLTTLLGGSLIYFMIPQLPYAVSLAIAAILSPTDPVAVQSIAKAAKLPANVVHLVAGESLINDASGLVAFKFALAAASIGTFSIFDATSEFFYISLVGAVVGIAVSSIFNYINDVLIAHGHNDVVFRVVMQLFSPFAIYFMAESINASGVIAVVTGAIIANLHTHNNVDTTGELTVIGFNTWNVFGYLLNGYLFVILGIELPVATEYHAATTSGSAVSLWLMLLYAFGTWTIMFAIRVLWTYGTQYVHHLSHKDEPASWRIAIISGLSGVRGAITMAGVMSVPILTETGKEFPQRDIMLFIAAVVIILSLVAAIVLLPLISNKHRNKLQQAPGEDHQHEAVAQYMTEPRARIYAFQTAVRTIEESRREANQAIAYDIILRYQLEIRRLQLQFMNTDRLNPILRAEMTLREIALDAERERLTELVHEDKIVALVYASEMRRLDRLEARLGSIIEHKRNRTIRNLHRILMQIIRNIRIWFSGESTDRLRQEYQFARHESAKAAIKKISEYVENNENNDIKVDQQTAYNLIIVYRAQIERAKWRESGLSMDDDETVQMELEVKGLNAQRDAIQHLYEAHFISYETGLKIRQSINFAEAGLLTEDQE